VGGLSQARRTLLGPRTLAAGAATLAWISQFRLTGDALLGNDTDRASPIPYRNSKLRRAS